MINFFMPQKRKTGPVVIDDDDSCRINLLGALSGRGSYKSAGK